MAETILNIVMIKEMIGSALVQGSNNASIHLSKEDAGQLIEFIDSIDVTISILQVKNAYINNRSNAQAMARQYFRSLWEEFATFRIEKFEGRNSDMPWGDRVEQEVNRLTPIRNKFIDFFVMLYEYTDDNDFSFGLFKELLQISYNEVENFERPGAYWLTDHFRVVIYEIFLHTIAYLIKEEKFKELEFLLVNHYQMKCIFGRTSSRPTIEFRSVNFAHFNLPVPSIDDIFRRRKNNVEFDLHRSLFADLLFTRISSVKNLMPVNVIEADIFLHYVSLFRFSFENNHQIIWIPHLSPYKKSDILEIMLKAVSKRVFEKIRIIFDSESPGDFKIRMEQVRKLQNDIYGSISFLQVPYLETALQFYFLGSQP